MGLLDKLFSKKPTRDEFAGLVQVELERRGVSGLRYIPEGFEIRIDSKNSFFLNNMFTDYCRAETKAERSERIRRYVSSFLDTPRMPKSFEPAKSHLLPIVRDPAYLSLFALKVRADGGDPSKLNIPTKVIAPGLVAAVAYDTDKTITNLSFDTLQEWGVDFEQALAAAMENLRNRPGENGFKPIIPGLYLSEFGDSYDSARLLLPELFYRLNLNGDPIVFAPNRDQVWVTGTYDEAGLKAILKYGPESHFNQGHSLSPNLYRISDSQLAEYVPESPAQREEARSLQRRRAQMDYEQQKDYLQKLNEREKRETFVASYTLYKRKDESTFSMSAWTKGVDSVLPMTDYLGFVVDPKKKDIFRVTWEEAIPIVASLMEAEPDLEPVRYRVRHFPDEAQVKQLRELAKDPGAV